MQDFQLLLPATQRMRIIDLTDIIANWVYRIKLIGQQMQVTPCNTI